LPAPRPAPPPPPLPPPPPPTASPPSPPPRRRPCPAPPAVDVGDAVPAQRARAPRGYPGVGIETAQGQRAAATLGQTPAAANDPRNAHAVAIGVDETGARQRHPARAGRGDRAARPQRPTRKDQRVRCALVTPRSTR